MSKVSVIITTYNQARFVVQAVESVLAQSFRNFEIIVIDDGSTDNTPESLAVYPDPITYIQRPHQGVMAARVTGVQVAKGAFLSFMHADDLMPPKGLELQVQRLEAQPELGLVYFGRQIQAGEATQMIREVESNRQDHLNSSLVAMNLFLSNCPLLRRDCIERAGLLKAALNSDNDWNPWKQISLAGYEIDPQEQLILCNEHLTIFLRKLYRGDIRAAQRHMTEAIRVFPLILKEPEVFINSVFDYAKSPNLNDAVAFGQTVLDNLPDCARELERFRPRILGELSIGRAFQSYRVGKMAQVRRDIVAGLHYDPSFLKNRGVVSIFRKSLLKRNGYEDKELDIPQSVIESVQEVLGQPVDSIERTAGGIWRNTYVIRTGGRPFILRVAKEQAGIMALSQVMVVIERVRAIGVPAPSILAYYSPLPDTPGFAWTIEEWVPGHHFVPQNMLRRDVLSAATELGQYLRRLHSIETREFGILSSTRLDAPYQTYDQWLDSQILDNCQTLARLPSETLPLIEAACQFLGESYRESSRLCHYDLHPWNLIIDKGRLSAVIDWGSAHCCDPAFDVATLHFSINDEQILTTLLQAYAPAQPEVFRRRVMAAVICYAASLLAWDFLKQTIDGEAVYRRCLGWLRDDSILSSFR
jgi:glycosyltransferase involved in cell wall biosynthesis/aminoglycoside phosphotransferase (APT) family kinase protein